MMKHGQPAQLHWFKSSYSGGEGGECVEVAADRTAIRVRDSKQRGGPQLAFARDTWAGFVGDGWFKSSYSSGEGGACVEVVADRTVIRVRDSKQRGGPELAFTGDVWAGFVAGAGRSRAN
jgi:hypothetical protein